MPALSSWATVAALTDPTVWMLRIVWAGRSTSSTLRKTGPAVLPVEQVSPTQW